MLQRCANPGCSVHFPAGASQCPACGTPKLHTSAVEETSVDPSSERPGNLTVEQRLGRQMLTTFLTLIIVSDLGIALLTILFGPDHSLSGIIRVGLTVLLCAGIYSGSRFAKWFSVVLFGLGILFSTALILRADNPLTAGLLIGLVGLFLSFAMALVGSRNVNAFLEYQRWKRRGPYDAESGEGKSTVTGVCQMCGATIQPGAATCAVCGEGLTGAGRADRRRLQPAASSPRRHLFIVALIFLPVLALAIYGYTRDTRVYTRITATYSHAPPLLIEARIAIPIEVALAGMPRLHDVISISGHGKAEFFLTWDGTYDRAELAERLAIVAEGLPRESGHPVVESVVEVPAARPEKEFVLVALVEPDKRALLRHHVAEEDVWDAVRAVYSETDEVKEQLARLIQVHVKAETHDVLLTDLAAVRAVERPVSIVRQYGRRVE